MNPRDTAVTISSVSSLHLAKHFYATASGTKLIYQDATDSCIRILHLPSNGKPVCVAASEITGKVKSIASVDKNQFSTLESDGDAKSMICYWDIPSAEKKSAELKPTSFVRISKSCDDISKHLHVGNNKIILVGSEIHVFDLDSKEMKTSRFLGSIVDAFCFHDGSVLGVVVHVASMAGANLRHFVFLDMNTLESLNAVDLPADPATACYAVTVLGKHDIAVGCQLSRSSFVVKYCDFSNLRSPKVVDERTVSAGDIKALTLDEHGNVQVVSSTGLHCVNRNPELTSTASKQLQFTSS